MGVRGRISTTRRLKQVPTKGLSSTPLREVLRLVFRLTFGGTGTVMGDGPGGRGRHRNWGDYSEREKTGVW